MESNELILRYLMGAASKDEVDELEQRLGNNKCLQDEYLRQAEIDAHLRQEAQLANGFDNPINPQVDRPLKSASLWKWVSGVSTLAASILLVVLALNFPAPRSAMAFPSLGKLSANIPWSQPSIWVAAGTGNVEMLRTEIEGGVAVDARIEKDLTPLHLTSLFNQAAAAELLLNEGADVTATDNQGNMALHMAVFLGNTEVVRILLSADADPLVRNGLGFNSLEIVAAPWSNKYEEYLREAEKELNTELDVRRIRTERPKILELLVSGADTAKSQSAVPIDIFYAAISGDANAIREHIAIGTDLNQVEQVGGSTPLILATIFGNRSVAEMLVEADADLEVRNKSGGTALHQACFFGRPEIVKILLQAGADRRKLNVFGLTPIDLAAKEMDSEWQAIYEHTYQTLNLDFDFEKLDRARDQIREIFKKYDSMESAR